MTAPLSAREPREFAPLRTAGAAVIPGGAPLTHRPKNPLLVRDDVGRGKASCYDLPDERFAYGRPGNQDVEGAREVSMRWVSHTPSMGPEATAPDFVNFNKKATHARITNAKDLKHFRKEHDVIAPAAPTPRSALGRPSSETYPRYKEGVVPASFTHGRKIRPSTPIGEVISYRFAERSERELHSFYTDFRELQETARTQVRKIPLTTASRGHASGAKKVLQQEESKDLFKLTKFKRIEAKVTAGRRKPDGHGGELFADDYVDEDRIPVGLEGVAPDLAGDFAAANY